MPRVGFEPTIPVFERAKTVRALERAATVIGERRWCMFPLAASDMHVQSRKEQRLRMR
jgi:hypothetical protein